MSIIKPMLASDYDESKLKFPLIVQPKIDGVRSLNQNGVLVGRSLKKHANKYVASLFSGPELDGLDGEICVTGKVTSQDACRATTSALNSIEGEPRVTWWIFDYITPETEGLPYSERYELARKKVLSLIGDFPNIDIIEADVVNSLPELLEFDSKCLDIGFEGTIIRDPNKPHKRGRSTVREGGLLRIKRFMEEEAVVVYVKEGKLNNNEATENELGLTSRSSHKENMIPNGQVGTIVCIDTKTGKEINVSPGRLTEQERIYYWYNQTEMIGKTIKYKFFPKGIKNKPRFPTFQSFRMSSDIGN